MRLLTLPLLLASSLALAHSDHAPLGAHVHGIAQLDVVLDGKSLLASFTSPAADIVGFEDQASDDQSIALVREMEHKLSHAETLWELPASANCTLNDVAIHHELLAEKESHDGHEHDHKHDHDHDHKHDHGHKHDHDHDHDHDHKHDHDHAGHSDLRVEYAFECQNPEQLAQISVTLFQHFPTLESITTQVITSGAQQGLTLNPENNRLNLD
ncbi:ZrgA family zinc uptake protein [Nitrincola alkalilacustris]|uniref:ZrgA family zinc uptake protein n=1 Tax=Nitrincola alkalilacustris TaxID=1571224 RepID=UPI00124F3299|nr:DUF2796 domain-containing protein [Nitrincola alkalilacustris]